ncbi:hypothetical protein [Aegicerativicinus sediminis]|uniref:hypothetical protein n=1 Tax=Aegicerativicinus sediminis TaxID=2893202 RepID=UPI001E62A677|nr:hypothetical protein [Aegicerativicinus sediminis]
MLKIYLSSICIIFCTCFLPAQDLEIFLPSYDGQIINHTSNAISVNDDVLITFQDKNITTNFFTEGMTELYLYGGLQTANGTMEGAPDITDTAAMPVFSLVSNDTDANAKPNTYDLKINLASWYSSVPDGVVVTKFNFYIRNSLGYEGENITTMISIDLKDATKDSTLDVTNKSMSQSLKIIKDELIFTNYNGKISVNAYDLTGRIVDHFEGMATSSKMSVFMALPKDQITLVVVENENSRKTFKTLNH